MQPTLPSTTQQSLPWGLGTWTTPIHTARLWGMDQRALWQMDGVLSPRQCDAVISRAESLGYAPTGGQYPAHYRNNDRLVTDDAALAHALYERIQPHLERTYTAADGSLWIPCGLNPRFRSCRYRHGQGFCVHQDGAYHPQEDLRTFWTLQVYLNDGNSFAGGTTRFYDGKDAPHATLAVQPVQGRAILFDHTLWHDGEPVPRGTKYVLRSDVMFRRVHGPAVAQGHQGYVMAVSTAPDGTVYSGGRDGTLRRDGVVVAQEEGSITAVCCVDTSTTWYGTRQGDVVCQRGSTTGQRVAQTHSAVLGACALGDGVVTAHADGVLRTWNGDGTRARAWTAHRGWTWAVAVTPDGGVVSVGEDGSVAVFAPEGWQKWRGWHPQPLHSVACVGDTVWCGTQDGFITVWERGRCTRQWKAHQGAVTSLVALEPGCVSGGEDGRVIHWKKAQRPTVLHVHAGMVRGLSVRDGRGASASYDGTVGRWQVP